MCSAPRCSFRLWDEILATMLLQLFPFSSSDDFHCWPDMQQRFTGYFIHPDPVGVRWV
jgi:hypothetical protein